MSGNARAGSGSLSSTLSSSGKCGHSPRTALLRPVEKPIHVTTLSVLGLSGTDGIKGNIGVGKSTLCNRLVRPHFIDFFGEHISYLSQADFSCSRVINGDHWIYFGEAELDANDYPGRTTHVRVVEQTVFLDDESFEPLGAASRASDYVKRSLKTSLESPGKLMYICRDQLGQESDFVCHPLPEGRTAVDGFVIAFDVSHVEGRYSFAKQAEFVLALVSGALKAKKPTFLVATKCDRMMPEGMTQFHKLLARKELKNHLGTLLYTAEVSAFENVNVADLLYLAAYVVDKTKNKPKLSSFVEMQRLRNEKLAIIRGEFLELLRSLLPREEYPLRQSNEVTWPILLTDFGVATNPVYEAFVAEFGPQSAQHQLKEHQRASREWWLEHEISARLPSLRDVLRKMFGRPVLCNAKWENLIEEIQAHAQFDSFFRPFGRSIDRFNSGIFDERIPSEILEKPEAKHLFLDLQKELIEEIALERQAERFRALLAQKEAVTPGKSFEDARVIIEEVAAFEQALPPDCARRIYDSYQQEIKRRACKDFTELLLEKVALFVDLVVAWRFEHSDVPMIGLDERENAILRSQLCEDKRYRDMNAMPVERQEAISRFASFFALPLVRHCPSAEMCSDMQASSSLSSRTSAQKSWSVSLAVYGSDHVADGFLSAVKSVTTRDGHYDYNGGTVRICCFRAGEGRSSSRVRTPVYLLDSLESTELVFSSQQKEAPRLPPVFVHVSDPSRFDLLPSLHQMVCQLAEKFNGAFVSASSPPGSRGSRMSGNEFSPYFRADQVQRVLNEVCAGQLDSGYADIRVRLSFACGDSFRMESVLKPLMEQCHNVDVAGHFLELDTTLAQEKVNLRVRADVCSYHNWMMSKWTLNTFQGHVLVYSPLRRASLRHVETAVRLLLDAASNCAGGAADRRAMARAILIVALDDPSNYFTNKEASQLLTEGAQLAEDAGCSFATVSPTRSHSSEFQTFVDFFEKLYKNDALPAEYYTVTQQSPSIFHSPSLKTSRTLTTYRGSTFTGSASTLLSNGSSNESACSGSVSHRPRSPHAASRTSMSPLATRSTTSTAIVSEEDLRKGVGILRIASKNGRQRGSKIRPCSTNLENTKTAHAAGKNGTNGVDVGGDFVYQVTCFLLTFLLYSLMFLASPSSTHSGPPIDQHPANYVKNDKRSSRILVRSPNVTRLRVNDDTSLSSESAASFASTSRMGQDSSLEPRDPTVRFRATCAEQLPVRCGLILNDRRLLSRSMDSLVQPTIIELRDEDPPSNPMAQSVICESGSYRQGQRQTSLRDRRRNRSARRWINENSSNFARRVTAGWKRNKKAGLAGEGASAASEPQSPAMEYNPLFKSSSAVSSAFSWLPTRSPKRKVKCDIDPSASPDASSGISLISLCNTADRLPLFVTTCIEYIEEKGGLRMEGIYRVSGSQNLAMELDKYMARPERLDLEAKDYPLPVVWMSVKNFFGSLHDALIPKTTHKSILECVSSTRAAASPADSAWSDSVCARLHEVIKEEIPELNRHVLRYLMTHLRRVASNSGQNAMDVRNLAKVWCPTIFQPDFQSFEELSGHLCVFETATVLMLTHSDLLFSPVDSQ